MAFGANLGVADTTAIFATAVWALIGGVVAIIYAFRLRFAWAPAIAYLTPAEFDG